MSTWIGSHKSRSPLSGCVHVYVFPRYTANTWSLFCTEAVSVIKFARGYRLVSVCMRESIQLYKWHTHTHTHLTSLFLGLARWASTSNIKPISILPKQETVSGSGISWAMCKPAPRSSQITMPALKFFTGWMPFLPPNWPTNSVRALKA